MSVTPEDLVDLDRYPVTSLDSPEAAAVIATHQAELHARGVSVLPGFVTGDGLEAMATECDKLAAHAHHQDVQGTPYLELPDDGWPDDHPRKAWSRSSVHTIGYDQFPSASPMRTLYEWDAFLAFLGRILGREPLYRYAD